MNLIPRVKRACVIGLLQLSSIYRFDLTGRASFAFFLLKKTKTKKTGGHHLLAPPSWPDSGEPLGGLGREPVKAVKVKSGD
jgi:hypothetical protein